MSEVGFSEVDTEMVVESEIFFFFLRISLCRRKGKKQHEAEGKEWGALLVDEDWGKAQNLEWTITWSSVCFRWLGLSLPSLIGHWMQAALGKDMDLGLTGQLGHPEGAPSGMQLVVSPFLKRNLGNHTMSTTFYILLSYLSTHSQGLINVNSLFFSANIF